MDILYLLTEDGLRESSFGDLLSCVCLLEDRMDEARKMQNIVMDELQRRRELKNEKR